MNYENARFPWQPLVRFLRVVVYQEDYSYLNCYISYSTKLGTKLKIRHKSFIQSHANYLSCMDYKQKTLKVTKIIKNITDISPKHSLLHVVISSAIKFDKSFHPVVLYENYIICILININENL